MFGSSSGRRKYFYPVMDSYASNPVLMTTWREPHASRYDRVVPKRKYLRFLRWVEAEKGSSKVESGKWRRLLLRKMCVAFDVSTDGHEEDFFPRSGMW
ncbi:hypothetical protein Tco_1322869 [Tanacetum coccineum]